MFKKERDTGANAKPCHIQAEQYRLPLSQEQAPEALINALVGLPVEHLTQLVATFDAAAVDPERWPMVLWLHGRSMELGLRGVRGLVCA